jgi:hypothetical protein
MVISGKVLEVSLSLKRKREKSLVNIPGLLFCLLSLGGEHRKK